MAWYANILTSLPVESGDGGHQEIIDYFLKYNMYNFFIKLK
jgi:hypothetical protein